MTTLIPSIQPLKYTHMYLHQDLHDTECKTKMCTTPGSIADYLYTGENFSKFLAIVDKAQMFGVLDNSQTNITLFVPENKYLENIPELDTGFARQILACCTLDRRIDRDLVTSSPFSYFPTKNPQNNMYVSNINNDTRINNQAQVVKFNINCTNGIIHIVDRLLVPSECHYLN